MTVAPKNIYTIPTHLCFVDTLADYIMDSHKGDMGAGNASDMSDTLVLLPTRRAIQALQEAFIRLSDGVPIILPRLCTLGDVDEDELLLSTTGLGEDYLTDQPAINPLRRRLVMAQMVHKLHTLEAQQNDTEIPTLAQILDLSDSLCHLLDQIHIEQVDINKIDSLAPDAFDSEHWAKNLKYLSQIKTVYPDYLKTLGLQDGMQRRNQLLQKQARLWQTKPPTGRIIIAGSTGTMPATADLMDAVATLPNGGGMVILPGLDMSLSGDDINAISTDPAHPQYGLIKLLNRLDVSVEGVKTIGTATPTTDRYQFLSQLMRPASTTHLWNEQVKTLSQNALDKITLTHCEDSLAEARTIALLMRHVAENNSQSDVKKTCTLITPDRNLSRQVLAILKRWGIDADDSAGVPLDNTKQGIFLRLMLWVVRDDFSPVALLSLLKHPMMAGGQKPHHMRQLARALEYAILRGVRMGGGLTGLKMALDRLKDSTNDFDKNKKIYLDDAYQVLDILKPLDDFAQMIRGSKMALAEIIQHHIATAEKLCTSDEQGGDAILWAGGAGDSLAQLLAGAMEQGDDTIIDEQADYGSILQTFMAGSVTRPHGVRHPRLKILGAIEARMIKSDVVILGGLNESTWPPTIESDHWLSRPMRHSLGLPPLERHISLSAHDFVQAFAAETVHMTRAKKVDSQPTIPSRWIDRMNAIIELAPNLSPCPSVPHAIWQAQLDDVDKQTFITPPAPVLSDDTRIDKLSSSDLEKLFVDPYGVYAKKILKLYKLDDPEQDISVADVGNIIHNTLEDYLLKYPDTLPADGRAQLQTMLDNQLKPYATDKAFMAYRKPIYQRMADWFMAQEKSHRPHIAYSYSELDGHYDMRLSTGNTVTLTARADRVDKMQDGTYRVVDYKTGKSATTKELSTAEKPQLLLASKILTDGVARSGGYTLPTAQIATAQYWKIKGQNNDEIQDLSDNLSAWVENFTQQTDAVLSHFENGGAYTVCRDKDSVPYNPYQHLSRISEWEDYND